MTRALTSEIALRLFKHCLVADIADLNVFGALRHFNLEKSVDVGYSSDFCPGDSDGGTDYRFALLVNHAATAIAVSSCKKLRRRQENCGS